MASPTPLDKAVKQDFWELTSEESEKVTDTLSSLKSLLKEKNAKSADGKSQSSQAEIAQGFITRIEIAWRIARIPGPRRAHWWVECMGRVSAADKWLERNSL